MDLIYSFDSSKFYLGTLCKKNHRWPGTNNSLRRLYKSPSGNAVNHCAGCTGRKINGNWLISFIDCEAMDLPAGSTFGKLCKGGHSWNGHEMTLRDRHRKCAECERERKRLIGAMPETRAKARQRYHNNRSHLIGKAKERWAQLASNPEYRKERAQKVREKRQKEGRLSQSKRCGGLLIPPQFIGTGINGNDLMVFQAAGVDIDHLTVEWVTGSKKIWERLQQLAVSPSVAELVENERRAYWATMPPERVALGRQRAKARERLRRKTDPEYVLYHRQKSKRRKALIRQLTAIQLSGRQVDGRFAQFGHCCAYCGKAGDLHIEHVVPISKGGPHSIGNIIPACRDCNFSKRDHEVESWYRKQSFFCERRWRKICRVLGWNRSAVGQLALL